MSTNTKLADEYKIPVEAYQLAAGATSGSVTLNETMWRERCAQLTAVGADIRWNVNAAASASTSHFLKQNETVKIKLPWEGGDAPVIHAIRDDDTSGTLEISTFREWS